MISEVVAGRAAYSEFELRLALLFNAIGHPTRVAIILAIIEKNNLIEREMIEIAGVNKTQVQKHLAELQRAGYIEGRIVGLKRSYSVNINTISELVVLFSRFKTMLSKREAI